MNKVDERQFAEYVQANRERFYRLAYGYVQNSHEALEIVSEATVKGILKLGSLREPAYLKTWFYRILVNESLNSLRRSKRFFIMEPLPEESWEKESGREAALDLRRALMALEPKLKTIILLRFYEEMKLEEIATVTALPLSTVKSRLYKALRLLKQDLEEEI